MLDWHSKSSLLCALTLTDDCGGYTEPVASPTTKSTTTTTTTHRNKFASQRVASHRIALLTLTGQASRQSGWQMSCLRCVPIKGVAACRIRSKQHLGIARVATSNMPGTVVRLPRVARDDKCNRRDEDEDDGDDDYDVEQR